MNCELCDASGGELLWCDRRCRVVAVANRDYPGFCRVIWNAHVTEMTDLPESERLHLMQVVFAVEQALRKTLTPQKINLASLGNQTPHLHWHVIPRHANDKHFPNSVWGEAMRRGRRRPAAEWAATVRAALASALGQPLSRRN